MVMTIYPRVVAALSGFERIQAFLLRSTLQVDRGAVPQEANSAAWNPSSSQLVAPRAAIRIRDLRIGDAQVLLNNVNIDIATGKLTIISGPTGSGKSALLRVILGEVASARGSVTLSTQQIAYCAQRPWLPIGTMREVIYGATKLTAEGEESHQKWYNQVINACCLVHDIDSLAHGDSTQIGSRGMNLSGGQRQRVVRSSWPEIHILSLGKETNLPFTQALARGLFARCDILLLDDTFSGLDGDTERIVFNNLFGPAGLLRQLGTTVVLISNSSKLFTSVDMSCPIPST
jgi:ATP-binding cassette, subfamily C (CFTR/MRP), member 1